MMRFSLNRTNSVWYAIIKTDTRDFSVMLHNGMTAKESLLLRISEQEADIKRRQGQVNLMREAIELI